MQKLSVIVTFLCAVSVARCQFFYNYEDDQGEDYSASQENDPSLYPYNPPSAVNEQFLQAARNSEPQQQMPRSETRSSRRRQAQPEPNNVPQPEPKYIPETDSEQAARQQRRQNRRRQRQKLQNLVETAPAPRMYSPSVFETISLGEAPNGVYIPQDSLLNVLRNPSQNNNAPIYVPPPEIPVSSRNYVQPSVFYQNNEPSRDYFVQPPNKEATRSRNAALPLVQPVTTDTAENSRNRRQRLRSQSQVSYSPQPTVDIDSYRQTPDDVIREDIQVVPQQTSTRQNQPRIVAVKPAQTQRNQFFSDGYYRGPTRPRVYSPSVFENVGLGEAPSGVYVPEDSLLNVLKNPSSRNRVQLQASPVESQQQFSVQQPVINTRSEANNALPVVTHEVSSSARPARGRSGQRRQGYAPRSAVVTRSQSIDEVEYYEPEQSVERLNPPQTSSGNKNSNRRRVNVAVRERRTELPPPSQPERHTRRSQTQVSPSSPQQSSFKPAKLAVAALPPDTDGDEIPGEAGTDYPTLHVIPKTGFSCSQQEHNGYYADLETSCQVVHLCQARGVQNSFLCPNGTIFSQEKFSCQWWYEVNCADSPRFYGNNDNLYKVPAKKERKRD